MTAEFSVNRPVAVTCPDCGGALKRRELGTLTQFSCNIGDVYIVGVIVAAQFLALERFVEQAMRSLSERAELCRIMMDKAGNGEAVEPTQWEDAMAEALDHTAGLVRPGDGAGAHGAPLRDGMVHGGDVIRDCWGRITGPEKAAW